MKTTLHVGELSLDVVHDPCSDPVGRLSGEIIESPSNSNNTLTVLSTLSGSLGIHWASHESYPHPQILIAPETHVIFFGTSQVVVAARFPTLQVLDVHFPECLFWSFQRYSEHVVQFGELECSLFDLAGKYLAKVPVDPPYEIDETIDGIRLVSSIYGEQSLRFANPGAPK